MRGRSDGDWYQSEHNQRLEVLGCEFTNSITSVQKDNYVIEIDDKSNTKSRGQGQPVHKH